MVFTWDPNKDLLNQSKHGISFSQAKEVFNDPFHLSILDNRFSYFEERWVSIGQANNLQVLVIAHLFFTDDGEEVIRIISAREATNHERQQYEEL